MAIDYSKDIDKLKWSSITTPTPSTTQPQVVNTTPAEWALRPIPAKLQKNKVDVQVPSTVSGIWAKPTIPAVASQESVQPNLSKEIPVSWTTANIVDLNKNMVNDLYNVGKSAFKNLVTHANNIQWAGRQILWEKLKNIQTYESQALWYLGNMKKYLTDAEDATMNKVNLSAATQKIQWMSDAKKMFAWNTGQDAAFVEQLETETNAKIADTKLKYTEWLINLEWQYKALKWEILDRTDINDNQKLQLVESVNQRLSDIEWQKMQFSSNLINQQYSVPMQLSQMLLQYAMAKKSSWWGWSFSDFLKNSGIEWADKIADAVENMPPDQKVAYDNITEDKANSLREKFKGALSTWLQSSWQSPISAWASRITS